MTNPDFSIATPTRNALEKLKRCVGSVRGQTGVSFEHLIQDARSSDGTPDWLAGQVALPYASEADSGMYDAINRAWRRSRGRFLSWLNADEQYLPGTLAKVQSFFDAHPEADIVFGNYIVTDPKGRAVALRREVPFRRIYVANGYLNAQSCTLFFRRRLLDSERLRLDTRYRYAADKDLMLRLATSGAGIRHIPDYLAIFGIDGSNLSTHPEAEKESEAIRRANGAFRSGALRSLVRAGRHVERFLRGGYRGASTSYRYASDETPQYVDYAVKGLGGRYSLADLEGRAEVIGEAGFR